MNVKNIVSGHMNEFFGLNKDISEERMKICKECPLYSVKLGQLICNSKLYLNVDTGDVSVKDKQGYKRGCGCRLLAKTSDINSVCPVGKW